MPWTSPLSAICRVPWHGSRSWLRRMSSVKRISDSSLTWNCVRRYIPVSVNSFLLAWFDANVHYSQVKSEYGLSCPTSRNTKRTHRFYFNISRYWPPYNIYIRNSWRSSHQLLVNIWKGCIAENSSHGAYRWRRRYMDEKLLMYSTFQYRIIISNVRYPTSVRTLDDRIWYYTTKVAVSLSAILILELDIRKLKGLVLNNCGNDPHNRHPKGTIMTGPFRRSHEFFFSFPVDVVEELRRWEIYAGGSAAPVRMCTYCVSFMDYCLNVHASCLEQAGVNIEWVETYIVCILSIWRTR